MGVCRAMFLPGIVWSGILLLDSVMGIPVDHIHGHPVPAVPPCVPQVMTLGLSLPVT